MHDHWYFHSQLEAASNHAKARMRLMKTWDELDFELESASVEGQNFSRGERWETEGDFYYRRWFSNFVNFFGGGALVHDKSFAVAGIGYLLPMLIESQVSISHEGKFRLDLEKRFQWTKSIFSEAEYSWKPGWGGERDNEFEVTLMYGPSWHWAAGIMLTEKSVGLGAQFQF